MISQEVLRASYEKARPLSRGVEYRPELGEYATFNGSLNNPHWGNYGNAFSANQEFHIWELALQSIAPAPGCHQVIAESLGSMVTEWVEGGLQMGTNWRTGLDYLIEKRLDRFLPAHDTGKVTTHG